MDLKQVAALVIRIISVLWFFSVIAQLHSFFVVPYELEGGISFAVPVLAISLQLIICAVALFFPLTIARWLVSLEQSNDSLTKSSPSVWLTLGLVFVGFLSLTNSVPDIIYWLTLYNFPYHIYELTPLDKANCIATTVEIAFAVILIVGARRIAALFKLG